LHLIGADIGNLRHGVDTSVALILAVFLGPIAESQDARKLRALGWRVLQPNLRQLLEIGAFFPLRRGICAILL
jgi:hypothetical protein